jgi:uncharacterized membrane protein
MYSLLVGLSVWFAAAAPPAQCLSADTATPLVLAAPANTSANAWIGSRTVKVEVQVYRNLMPWAGLAQGDLNLQVRLSTRDPRGLPTISTIRAKVTNIRRQTWSPELSPFRTLVFDPNSMMWGSTGGPRWQKGSQVTVRVEIRSGQRTATVNIPARISAVY